MFFLTWASQAILIRSVIQKIRFLLILLLTLPALAQSPPANDAFNSRLTIPGVTPYTISTSNIGATVQGGEATLNGLIGSTLWWQWTSPVSDWVRIDTQGSSIDTVLRVNSSQGQGGTMFGYNDDVEPLTVTSSLTFFATANTTYYLQVGGYQGEQGNIQLNLNTGTVATPSHWPVGVAYTPASVNVNSGNAALQTIIEVGGTGGIAGTVDLQFLRANAPAISPELTGQRNYISGSLAADVHCLIPQYSQNGTWHPLVTLTPQTGPVLRFGGTDSGRPYLLGTGTLTPLSVTSSQSDITAPALSAFSISTSQVDVNQGPATVSISATASDDLSGIDQLEVWLYHPVTASLHLLLPVTLTSGTFTSGTWTAQATIPKEYPSETYAVNIILRDKALNQAIYGPNSTLETPGGDLFMAIQGGGAYWRWAYQNIRPHSTLVDLTADANGDGINNLLCYAFGIDPIAPAPSGSLPLIALEAPSPSRLAITYQQNTADGTGILYFPEFSSHLTAWQASGNAPTMISESGTWQQWKVTDDRTTSSAERRFGRLRVIYADTSP